MGADNTLALLGAGGFGALVGWYVYYINRYRKGDVQLSDLTTLIGVLGGGTVTALFSPTGELFGAYGVGLFIGFFGYFVTLIFLVGKSVNFDADWFLDGRRVRPVEPYYIPDGTAPTVHPMSPIQITAAGPVHLQTGPEPGPSIATTPRPAVPQPQLPAPEVRSEPEEPEDDPGRRHRELRKDRYSGENQTNLAEARLRSLAARGAMAPAPHAGAPAVGGANNWVPLGPLAIPGGQTTEYARVLVSGRVTAIVPHPTQPSTIYLGAARGGVWKTVDDGTTWTPMSDNEKSLAIGTLAVAPADGDRLYAGTGEGNIYYYNVAMPLDSINASYNGAGILVSRNGGTTWTQSGVPALAGACFYRIAVHPTNPDRALAASSFGLFRTLDGGTTWNQLTGGLPAISPSVIAACDVAISPASPDTAFVAFWASGIYQTSQAWAAGPQWQKLGNGLPAQGFGRVALAMSKTAPNRIYALYGNTDDSFVGLFMGSGAGTPFWQRVSGTQGITVYGNYTLDLAVDAASPDVVYVSGYSLYKGVRNAGNGSWFFTDIGMNIHPDHHTVAIDPRDPATLYAGSDGGIYRTRNGGVNWDDSINAGLSIAQFEFIDQHPVSDAIVFGGTQDNGTEQFRNSPVFYHAADGDGGFVAVDPGNPSNVLHEYYGIQLWRSAAGGDFNSWNDVSGGISGYPLFYPPFALCQTNSQEIAFGTDMLSLDTAQGANGWATKIALPGINGRYERVSAINYLASDRILAGTSAGGVYLATRSGQVWSAVRISAPPLPTRWIWDVAVDPADSNRMIAVMAGFGTPHVWSGELAANGKSATWQTCSGNLPDAPANALVIDPGKPGHLYIGTDIGVFHSPDWGQNWEPFSDGLPNVAVYDLKLHQTRPLLRAGTHGRGLWERSLDGSINGDVNLYLRSNVMDTARFFPRNDQTTASFAEPLQAVAVGDTLTWAQCADIKVDAPASGSQSFQMPVQSVDYLAFEAILNNCNPAAGSLNRVYVQLHSRGIRAASNVTVRLYWAVASNGYPDLPADFWTTFPGDSTDQSVWKPLGPAATVASVPPLRPQVIEIDWTLPAGIAQDVCLLAVVDCAGDPIPASSKGMVAIANLLHAERRVGLRRLTPVSG